MNENGNKLTLGIEGGASKTSWVLLRQDGNSTVTADQGQLPAANFRLITEEHLRQLLAQLPSNVDQAGVFLAGCGNEADRTRLRAICQSVWPAARLAVGGDRESGYAAAFGSDNGIAVISGSGSAATGHKDGKIENAGGNGHLLGDVGGGYSIGLKGLRSVFRRYDLEHHTSPLAEEILRSLMLNRMEDLIGWAQSADKMAIAGLSPVMFAAAEAGDQKLRTIIEAGALSLAQYTQSVAGWLELESPNVKLQGGIFLHRPMFVDFYKKSLAPLLATSSIETCDTSGAVGAAWLAASVTAPFEREKIEIATDHAKAEELDQAATEQTNPRSATIGSLNSGALVDLFVNEENYVAGALFAERKPLAKAVDLIAAAFRRDGRLFYVGAGTSGRLGTLDASEIPPTFGELPTRVQAIMAGGSKALHSSVEGAEDNAELGRMSVTERGVTPNDVVCGITASGRTPFVISALAKAKEIGAATILLTCNPARIRSTAFDAEIDLPTGPELVTGSTRLKAGTATKVALNILSTCSLILVGKTQGNYMTGMRTSNAKLRHRAIRMVSLLKGITAGEAEKLLGDKAWNVVEALK